MSLSDFRPPPSRMLPVLVLADVSASMKGHKLAAQNESIAEMIDAFRADSATRGAVHLAVISFGGDAAELAVPLTRIEDVTWKDSLGAAGRTPWGAAISLASDVLAELPDTAYQPTIVMTSDGIPTDIWQPALDRLIGTKRGAQANRYAIAIGEDADSSRLAQFAGAAERVLSAQEASDIVEYFRRITMQVTQALVRGAYQSGLKPLTDDF